MANIVICNMCDRCKEANMCGGAHPHKYQEDECDKCPFDKSARCVQVEEYVRTGV